MEAEVQFEKESGKAFALVMLILAILALAGGRESKSPEQLDLEGIEPLVEMMR